MTSAVEQIAVAVVRRSTAAGASEFLVGVRGADQTLPGRHEFPGGRIRPDESVPVAAVRECLEETGISVQPVDTLCVTEHEYAFARLRLHFVLCHAESAHSPHPPFRWLPANQIEVDRFPAANREVLQRLLGCEPKS